jgi:hypothetical protein
MSRLRPGISTVLGCPAAALLQKLPWRRGAKPSRVRPPASLCQVFRDFVRPVDLGVWSSLRFRITSHAKSFPRVGQGRAARHHILGCRRAKTSDGARAAAPSKDERCSRCRARRMLKIFRASCEKSRSRVMAQIRHGSFCDSGCSSAANDVLNHDRAAAWPPKAT